MKAYWFHWFHLGWKMEQGDQELIAKNFKTLLQIRKKEKKEAIARWRIQELQHSFQKSVPRNISILAKLPLSKQTKGKHRWHSFPYSRN